MTTRLPLRPATPAEIAAARAVLDAPPARRKQRAGSHSRQPSTAPTSLEAALRRVGGDPLRSAEQVAASAGISVRALLSTSRASAHVDARRAWWAELRALGWSCAEIGRLAGRHAGTIADATRDAPVRPHALPEIPDLDVPERP